MKMTINFTDAKEFGAFLPAGKHTVKIKAIKAESTKNGYPQVHITFADKDDREFTHYQSADFEQDWVRNWFYNFCKNAGLKVEKTNFTFDTNDLIGKPLFVDIQREYNDYSDKFVNRLKYTAKFEKEKADNWNEEYPISPEEQAHKAKESNNNTQSTNPFAQPAATDNPFAQATTDTADSTEDYPF